ncbi:hypothetical protein SAMN04488056_10284 [Cohaesibacter marisflavi]|uniref:GpW protein n=1 Tax=Cohaesibacter marisflavi TaxID=655353 RepID=A0A1I5C1U9_9HYPH|nr:hypothetical protein [Cohaesibacter marisflavi]SFN80887.1 hypothetical protein SAMN04488056_10284 [Cohaesibacter marisflavi]
MPSLNELMIWRDALEKAKASGVRSVEFSDGRKTEYKSDSEMRAALLRIERQISSMSGKTLKRARIISNKGA